MSSNSFCFVQRESTAHFPRRSCFLPSPLSQLLYRSIISCYKMTATPPLVLASLISSAHFLAFPFPLVYLVCHVCVRDKYVRNEPEKSLIFSLLHNKHTCTAYLTRCLRSARRRGDHCASITSFLHFSTIPLSLSVPSSRSLIFRFKVVYFEPSTANNCRRFAWLHSGKWWTCRGWTNQRPLRIDCAATGVI